MSRRRDITETLANTVGGFGTNTVGGFGIAYLISLYVFPVIGVHTNPTTALGATFTMFIVSNIRAFALRRMFRWLEYKT